MFVIFVMNESAERLICFIHLIVKSGCLLTCVFVILTFSPIYLCIYVLCYLASSPCEGNIIPSN